MNEQIWGPGEYVTLLLLILVALVLLSKSITGIRMWWRGRNRPATIAYSWGGQSPFDAVTERVVQPVRKPSNSPNTPLALVEQGPRTLDAFHTLPPDVRMHTLIAAKTGDGKTQTSISAMVQDIGRGCQVAWLNPQLALYHPTDQPADLRPIADRFEQIDEYPHILAALDRAYAIGQERKALYKRGLAVGHHIVLYLDEWPSIFDALGDEASKRVARIVRECRKLNIWVVLATQDAQISTLGFHSGVRAMFTTRLAGNVEAATWKAVMGDGVKRVPVVKGTWQTEAGIMPAYQATPEYIQRLTMFPPRRFAPLVDRTDFVLEPVSSPFERAEPTVWTEQHVKVAAWLTENSSISTRELARRLYPGTDGGGDYSVKTKAVRRVVEAVLGVSGREFALAAVGAEQPNG